MQKQQHLLCQLRQNDEVFLEEWNYRMVSNGHRISGAIREVGKKEPNVLITGHVGCGSCLINGLGYY